MNSTAELGITEDKHGGPLLECLLQLARAHSITVSRETLLAGLPLQNGQLSPDLFARAAQRAGLNSNTVAAELEQLNSFLFPVVLVLKKNRAVLLTEINSEDATAEVVFPELGEASTRIPLEELKQLYTGRAIYARPQLRYDSRNLKIQKRKEGHWFWQVIAQHRDLYRDVLLAAFIINMFAIAMPMFIMNVYDRVVPNHATDTLWILAVGVILVLCADFGLRMLRAWFVDLAASRIDITLSSTIMEHVLGIKVSERPASVGSFAAGLQSFEAVRGFIASASVIALIDLPFVLMFTVIIGLINWYLTIPIIIGIFVVLIYTSAVHGKMRELSERSMEASAYRNGVLVESLTSLETLKSLGAEGRMQGIWEKTTVALSRIGTKTKMLSSSVSSGATWVQQTVSIAIVITGVYLITNGELSQGGLIAAYLLSSRVMAPVGQSAGLLMQYHQAATALTAANQTMAKEVERPEGQHWISRPRLKGEIQFKNVNFQYPDDDREVLRDISFSIKPAEHVAILGRNGSGKTTIEKMVAGLYQPTSGAVLLDGIDIRQLDPAELRRNTGYVGQDVHLFFGSLRENITIADPNLSDERLLAAIKLAGLQEFINRHPSGLEMQVGERGELLSGGQKQSVAIARALLHDPTILLFDEPTASMDHSSEEEFKRAVAKFAVGKTLILVSHRSSLLTLVDRIIVIDNGKIVADGPKDQVVQALRHGKVGRAQ